MTERPVPLTLEDLAIIGSIKRVKMKRTSEVVAAASSILNDPEVSERQLVHRLDRLSGIGLVAPIDGTLTVLPRGERAVEATAKRVEAVYNAATGA